MFGYDDLDEFKQNIIDVYLPDLHATAFTAGIRGYAPITHSQNHVIGIVGKPANLTAVTKGGQKIPVTVVLKTWTDSMKILYAVVIETKTSTLNSIKDVGNEI